MSSASASAAVAASIVSPVVITEEPWRVASRKTTYIGLTPAPSSTWRTCAFADMRFAAAGFAADLRFG
jgi:hypothetical protein